MRYLRVIVPLLVAVVATSVAVELTLLPHPHDCGGGGFGMSNSEFVGGANVTNASYTTLAFPDGASVRYHWATADGGPVSFYVQHPDGHQDAFPSVSSGDGTFIAVQGEYRFGLGPVPADQTVDVSYSAVCN